MSMRSVLGTAIVALLGCLTGCVATTEGGGASFRLTPPPQDLEDVAEIRLKRATFIPSPDAVQDTSGLLLIQAWPGARAELVAGLKSLDDAGVILDGYVPNNAVAAYVPPGTDLSSLPIRWSKRLEPEWKLSRPLDLANSNRRVKALVYLRPGAGGLDILRRRRRSARERFAPDVVRIWDPALLPGVVGLEATVRFLRETVARHEDVTWLRLAPAELGSGKVGGSCPGPVTSAGPLPEYAEGVGGWAVNKKREAKLEWFLHQEMGPPGRRAALLVALAAWSEYSEIEWKEAAQPPGNGQVEVKFVIEGPHGDAWPFKEYGDVLGHAFSPRKGHPEPLAGDIHVNHNRKFYTTTPYPGHFHLPTVLTHEIGHALGLPHSDVPEAVMYPVIYEKQPKPLRNDDQCAIRQLYAPTSLTVVCH